MYFTVKDYDYIRQDITVSKYIKDKASDSVASKLMKGLSNIDKLQPFDIFKVIDVYSYSDEDQYMFVVLENDKGVFITRQDNIEIHEDPKDILADYGFKHLIKSGNKTILIDRDNSKYITTLQPNDKDDPEKALMILLLKAEGYNVKDIYEMVKLITDK